MAFTVTGSVFAGAPSSAALVVFPAAAAPGLDRGEAAERYVTAVAAESPFAPRRRDPEAVSEERVGKDRCAEIPRWAEPRRCRGHKVVHFNERGEVRGIAWFGYMPACGCPGCRREFVRRKLRSVANRGEVSAALHFVATVPEELRRLVTADKLALFRKTAYEAAAAAAAEILAVDDFGGFATVHPAGGGSPRTYAPHVDGFLVGPALQRLADGATCGALKVAFRRAWREGLARLCGKSPRDIVLPQAHVRWFDDDGTPALREAMKDCLRSFPGWTLPTRLAFYGELRHARHEGERESREPLFDSGAIPFETLVEAHGEARVRFLLREAELKFYAARESERLELAARAATSISAASPRSSPFERGEPAPLGLAAAPGPTRWSITVDVRGVTAYDPDLHRGRVFERVRGADTRLAAALRRAAREIKRARYEPIPDAAAFALKSAGRELEALTEAVARRCRPSVANAAEWLRAALTGLRAMADGSGTEVTAFDREPPLAICGLLARSELRFVFEQVGIAVAVPAPPQEAPATSGSSGIGQEDA